jgi:hypothetical protein
VRQRWDAQPDRSSAGEPAALLDRHGGLRRSPSPQPQTAFAWPRLCAAPLSTHRSGRRNDVRRDQRNFRNCSKRRRAIDDVAHFLAGRGLREDLRRRWRIGLPGVCEHW